MTQQSSQPPQVALTLALALDSAPKAVSPTVACIPWSQALETALRRQVVEEAMSWLRTPYMQQQDKKGGGVDCSMLLVRCWVDTGILQPFDPRPYSPNWHMHKEEEKYLAWMDTLAVPIKREELDIADVLLFKVGKCFAHAGIVTELSPDGRIKIVHAHADLKSVQRSWSDLPLLKYFGRNKADAGVLRPVVYYSVFKKIRQELSQ